MFLILTKWFDFIVGISLNNFFIALSYIPHLTSKLWQNSLNQQSMKFKLVPIASNASVIELLDIGLSPILISSSSYEGYFYKVKLYNT